MKIIVWSQNCMVDCPIKRVVVETFKNVFINWETTKNHKLLAMY